MSGHYHYLPSTTENHSSSQPPQVACAPQQFAATATTLTCVNCYANAQQSVNGSTLFRRENLQTNVVLPDSHSRPSELVVALTMYNESPEDLTRTMLGVVENLTDLQISNTVDSKRVTIALVADGADRVHPRTKAWLQQHGYFDANNHDYLNGCADNAVIMHFFTSMHTFKLSVSHQNPNGGIIEVRFIYLLKKIMQKNLIPIHGY